MNQELQGLQDSFDHKMSLQASSTSRSTQQSSYVINKYCIPRPLQVCKKLEREQSVGEQMFLDEKKRQKISQLQRIQAKNLEKTVQGLKGKPHQLKKLFQLSKAKSIIKKLRPLSCINNQSESILNNQLGFDMSIITPSKIQKQTQRFPTLNMNQSQEIQNLSSSIQLPAVKLKTRSSFGINLTQKYSNMNILSQSTLLQGTPAFTQGTSTPGNRSNSISKIFTNAQLKIPLKNTKKPQKTIPKPRKIESNASDSQFSNVISIEDQQQTKNNQQNQVQSFSQSRIRRKIDLLMKIKQQQKNAINSSKNCQDLEMIEIATSESNFEDGDDSILQSKPLIRQKFGDNDKNLKNQGSDIIDKSRSQDAEIYLKFLKFKLQRDKELETQNNYVSFKKVQQNQD